MAWTCPACRTQICHAAEVVGDRTIYRCHVCRIELVYDAEFKTLCVAPAQAAEFDESVAHHPKSAA